MLSRWLRWLVVTPVVLFVLGAIFLSCGGSSGGGATPTRAPGFSLQAITISTGAPPAPTFTPSPTPTGSGTPKRTPKPTFTKTITPTLTPRPAATSTTIAPGSVPTGATISFNAIGTFTKKSKTKFIDITAGPFTLWTSSDNTVLQAPPSGTMGGVYTTNLAGCVCILASSAGVSSQFVPIGVYTPVETCPLCAPLPPTPTATATSTPAAGVKSASSSTPAASTHNAGVLMWTFDAGAELRGRIAVGADGSIFFITRDGVLHGLDSTGKEIMHRDAAGSSPAVMPDGTVIAMASSSALAAIRPGADALWNLEIGDSAGPLAVSDRAIYASVGADLVSVSTTGSLNWRVNVGAVTGAAATPDGVVVGTSRGAVTAIASDGAVVWTFQPDGGFSGSVAYSDDVVYAGSAGGGVYAIDLRTGSPIWHVNSTRAVTAGPVVAPSGTIFAGAGTTYGITTDGQLHWKNSSLKPGEAGLIVLGYDGMFEAAAGDLGAVLMGDGSYVWTARSFGKITTAASSPAGMLYVGTSTGRIFAVR
jgi:outer membrane protein assembly factor BamB